MLRKLHRQLKQRMNSSCSVVPKGAAQAVVLGHVREDLVSADPVNADPKGVVVLMREAAVAARVRKANARPVPACAAAVVARRWLVVRADHVAQVLMVPARKRADLGLSVAISMLKSPN
jgi:hypothetical protein